MNSYESLPAPRPCDRIPTHLAPPAPIGYGTPAEHRSAVRADRLADFASDMRVIGWLVTISLIVLAVVFQDDGITEMTFR